MAANPREKVLGERPFTTEEQEQIRHKLVELDERREREKRGIERIFRVKLGTHGECGGSVEFRQVSTRYGSKMAGRTRLEEPTCRCEACGVVFDPTLPKYQRKIQRAEGKGE